MFDRIEIILCLILLAVVLFKNAKLLVNFIKLRDRGLKVSGIVVKLKKIIVPQRWTEKLLKLKPEHRLHIEYVFEIEKGIKSTGECYLGRECKDTFVERLSEGSVIDICYDRRNPQNSFIVALMTPFISHYRTACLVITILAVPVFYF